MAYIHKRSAFRYTAQVRKKGFPSVHKTFPTREEAELWAKEVEASMTRGVWRSHNEAEATTLKEAMDRYLREVTPHKKSHRREGERIRQMQAMPIASRFLADLRGMDLAKYRDGRLAEVGPGTVCREMALISHVYTICRKEWGMDYLANPVSAVRMPKNPPGRDRRLEHGEEERLMRELGGEMKAIVTLAVETAMRRGELAALRWEWVRYPVIRLPDTKNGKPRTVPLSTTAVEVLKGLPRRLDGRVFGICPEEVSRQFQAACGRAGIEGMVFHSLRHEATSRLFEKGLDMMEVASITGHQTLTMLRRYTHLRVHDLAKKLG